MCAPPMWARSGFTIFFVIDLGHWVYPIRLLGLGSQFEYVAAVNVSMWRPESLVSVSLCTYSTGADRRGAGNLNGNPRFD